MINNQILPPDAAKRRARVYTAGRCEVCRHEPLDGGRRKVVWTETDEPDRLCSEIEPCPWIACPHAKENQVLMAGDGGKEKA